MTGFGRAEAERDGRSLVAEARSVNHRYLELSLRMPRGFQAHEGRLRALLQEKLARGKVNLNVSWKGGTENGGLLAVNEDLAQRYVDAMESLRARFGFRDPVTLGQITTLPEVFTWREPDLEAEEAWELISTVVTRATDELTTMRRAEGEALVKDLLARVTALRTHLDAVESRAPHRVQEA
jgi:uncharacterized protein (TIGR00255 family)